MFRAKDIQPPRVRSKVIVATEYVTSLAVHDINTGLTYMMPPELGLLQHYKLDLLTDGLPQHDVPVHLKHSVTLKYRPKFQHNVKIVKSVLAKDYNFAFCIEAK